MKHMKRMASLVLALAMALTLAVPAMAADTGSITVENPVAGETYTAYKIFDVVYSGDAHAYTISASSEWLSVVKDYNGITLTGPVSEKYNVSKNDSFSAAAFAKLLKENKEGKNGGGELTATTDGKMAITGLDLGYYFVTSTNGALCNLTTTNSTATIYDKNEITFDKVDDDDSVEVGQTVNYDVTGKVQSTTGYTTYTYEIKDTMSPGLTFQNDVAVSIPGAIMTENENYTVTYTSNGFVLNIDMMKLQDYVGKELKVEYSAIVNENAVAKVEKNTATLTYSNNPSDASETGKITKDQKVYTAKLVIDKYAADNKTTKLDGAKFVLLNGKGEFYKYDNVNNKVLWVSNIGEATEVTTGEDGVAGAAEFIGLENGDYLLRETEAPAGYNKLTADVNVKIEGTNTNVGTLTVNQPVANDTGSELPETGGMGTTLFYALGAVLVIGAGVAMVTKKRMA